MCSSSLSYLSHRGSLSDRSSTHLLHCPRCSPRWDSPYSRSSLHSISYPPSAPPLLIKVSRAETCSRSIPTQCEAGDAHSSFSPLIPHLCRPESQGLVCAAVYILLLILFIPFPFSNSIANLPRKGTPLEGLLGAASLHHEVCTHSHRAYCGLTSGTSYPCTCLPCCPC